MRAAALAVLFVFGTTACADRHLPTSVEGPAADIVIQAVVLEVENLDNDGPGSLRATIAAAQNGHVITFAPDLAGGTIMLESALTLGKSLTIFGPEGGIVLEGTGADRIIRIGSLYEVVLVNLTIRNGRADAGATPGAFGGGIYNGGSNLTLRQVTVEDNWAGSAGGGIMNSGGTLTIVNSTIGYNGMDPAGATGFGGGIANNHGQLVIVNSTLSGNTAANEGGAIHNLRGDLHVLHATVADNGATRAGGIFSFGDSTDPATVELMNAIVAANISSTASNGPDIFNFGESEVSATHTLIGTTTGYALAVDGGGNLPGADPKFELDGFGKPLLSDNGGPTRTHALLDGSPAIDAADGGACADARVAGRDQRGVNRPQGPACDMGAYEAIGAAPPPPPAVVADFGLNERGTVDRNTGFATVDGTMTCSTPGPVQLRVELAQEQKQRGVITTVVGATTVVVDCDGTMAWAAGLTASNGVFTNGKAQATATVLDVAAPGPQAATVQLFWSR
jgi:hypothetical protein